MIALAPAAGLSSVLALPPLTVEVAAGSAPNFTAAFARAVGRVPQALFRSSSGSAPQADADPPGELAAPQLVCVAPVAAFLPPVLPPAAPNPVPPLEPPPTAERSPAERLPAERSPAERSPAEPSTGLPPANDLVADVASRQIRACDALVDFAAAAEAPAFQAAAPAGLAPSPAAEAEVIPPKSIPPAAAGMTEDPSRRVLPSSRPRVPDPPAASACGESALVEPAPSPIPLKDTDAAPQAGTAPATRSLRPAAAKRPAAAPQSSTPAQPEFPAEPKQAAAFTPSVPAIAPVAPAAKSSSGERATASPGETAAMRRPTMTSPDGDRQNIANILPASWPPRQSAPLEGGRPPIPLAVTPAQETAPAQTGEPGIGPQASAPQEIVPPRIGPQEAAPREAGRQVMGPPETGPSELAFSGVLSAEPPDPRGRIRPEADRSEDARPQPNTPAAPPAARTPHRAAAGEGIEARAVGRPPDLPAPSDSNATPSSPARIFEEPQTAPEAADRGTQAAPREALPAAPPEPASASPAGQPRRALGIAPRAAGNLPGAPLQDAAAARPDHDGEEAPKERGGSNPRGGSSAARAPLPAETKERPDEFPRPVPLAAPALRRDAADAGTPAPPPAPRPRAAETALPEPARPAPAAREIKLQVAGAERLELRMVERGGNVHVAVRTADARLAGALREDLPALSAQLEKHGFRAGNWQTGAAEAQARAGAVDAAPGSHAHDPQGRSGAQRDGREQHEPRAPHAPHRKNDGKDFAWLFTSLR